MIINISPLTDLKIERLEDLRKLKILEEENIKINVSEIARKMDKDRRTIRKYINGYEKKKTRNRRPILDEYQNTIRDLLSKETYERTGKRFFYIESLYRYMKDVYQIECASSTFRRYINSIEEFRNYFRRRMDTGPSSSRFETGMGEQAQLDWKENIDFQLDTGEIVKINIFSLILSYSRFRIYRLSLEKTQDVLLNFLNDAFETIGGVPKEILTDNMKTVMKIPRTRHQSGEVNVRFQQFADDYGFRVRPCIAGKPNTKAKVESPMRILDDLRGYSGDLSLAQLSMKLEEINNRENTRYHDSYRIIPVIGLSKEKDFLSPLPDKGIRNLYSITTTSLKVNASSMITFRGNQYSVPFDLIGKRVQVQVYDDKIHVYYSTNLVTIHDISQRPLNYLEGHYIDIMSRTLPYHDDIKGLARENLKKIGERYDENTTRTTDKEP